MKQLHYVAAALMLFGAHSVLAQAASGTGAPPKGGGAAEIAKTAMHTPTCQSIISECKSLGFIVGQAKEDNGLWKDCFGPVVKGGSPTRRRAAGRRARAALTGLSHCLVLLGVLQVR